MKRRISINESKIGWMRWRKREERSPAANERKCFPKEWSKGPRSGTTTFEVSALLLYNLAGGFISHSCCAWSAAPAAIYAISLFVFLKKQRGINKMYNREAEAAALFPAEPERRLLRGETRLNEKKQSAGESAKNYFTINTRTPAGEGGWAALLSHETLCHPNGILK